MPRYHVSSSCMEWHSTLEITADNSEAAIQAHKKAHPDDHWVDSITCTDVDALEIDLRAGKVNPIAASFLKNMVERYEEGYAYRSCGYNSTV